MRENAWPHAGLRWEDPGPGAACCRLLIELLSALGPPWPRPKHGAASFPSSVRHAHGTPGVWAGRAAQTCLQGHLCSFAVKLNILQFPMHFTTAVQTSKAGRKTPVFDALVDGCQAVSRALVRDYLLNPPSIFSRILISSHI